MKKKSEDEAGRKARAECKEEKELNEWAAQYGQAFWDHVPVVKLGDPEFVEPDWYLDVYGGRRGKR
jgi:hypothetical protein